MFAFIALIVAIVGAVLTYGGTTLTVLHAFTFVFIVLALLAAELLWATPFVRSHRKGGV